MAEAPGGKAACYAHTFSPWWHGCTDDHHEHWDRRRPDGSWECPQRRRYDTRADEAVEGQRLIVTLALLALGALCGAFWREIAHLVRAAL